MSLNILKLYQQCASYGNFGKRIFSIAFCTQAPYFWTIRPFVAQLEPGKTVVTMPHRKLSSNHLGTQHAIACCNLVEMAMGCVAEATLPSHLRWIPRGMEVKYLAKANGTLTATSEIDPVTFFDLEEYPGNVQVPVVVTDDQGKQVVTASVELYISEKPARK
ncbi:Thioesterase (4HBT) superfamily enzyme [Seminavis robusta]|uniref:Thioesterase (4HBT) superfamily enzyme n=1 Tax=Seminavis robusta TaxID=568900 RepID=A0A9N8ETM6_9STRA|nr:Thioesterase (4HBT) superfamily enzyme [Seminavis robusta]|eukprot:Sro1786_g297460.1 Thioesterase (4HBT) superfamily enzyme (162) ;mRNA; r:19229-19714